MIRNALKILFLSLLALAFVREPALAAKIRQCKVVPMENMDLVNEIETDFLGARASKFCFTGKIKFDNRIVLVFSEKVRNQRSLSDLIFSRPKNYFMQINYEASVDIESGKVISFTLSR
jgi:hypothetical protein